MRRAAVMHVLLPIVATSALGGHVAHADPQVASVDDDLDGDGNAEHVGVTGDGVLHISGAHGKELKIAGTIAAAKLGIAHASSGVLVVVKLATEAVIVGGPARGGWHELGRFPIGPVGVDGEYALDVEASAAGVIRYQTRGDLHRCDGHPLYVFPELYDPATNRLAATKPPLDVATPAPALAARVDATAPQAAPLVYQARAVSTQPGAPNAGLFALPRELDDGKLDTSWHEELAGDGHGSVFTFDPRVDGAKARQLRIVGGNHASASALRASNRPKRIAIVGKDVAWWVELPDPARDPLGTAYVVDLPQPVAGCLSVILDRTYGSDAGTTAISELEVYADGERTGGGDALLAAAVADGKNDKASGAALARRGAAGVAALEAELARRSDGSSRARLVRALVTMRDPAAATALGHVVEQRLVAGVDLVAVIDALGVLGPSGGGTDVLHKLALARDTDTDVRLAAVRALPGKTAEGLAALADLAGRGSRELRRAVIEELEAAPIDALIQLATSSSAAAASGDAWRAIVHSARRDRTRRPAALAALVDQLATATDYERRYRIVEGIATLGDAQALYKLATTLKALPITNESAALRTVVARAFAVAPRRDASDFVLALVADPDPGVRLAALAALGATERGGDPAGPWTASGASGSSAANGGAANSGAANGGAASGLAGVDRTIIGTLGTDRWPEVRQRAAEALAIRCQRPDPAKALESAVTTDRDVNVSGAALAALVDCRAPAAATLLARVWDDPKLALPLRARAVDLAIALGDPALGPKLVAKLASWRGAAMSSAEALELSRHAAPAIGRLAPPAAVNALMDALDDSAFPEIVAAAAAGLGFLGPACPSSARARLKTLSQSEEQQVSIAASRAFKQCGR